KYINLFFVFFLLLTSCDRQSEEKKRPNIVFIVADDLGWKDLHGYGNEIVETPNLDRLANEGIKFTQAYASCTVSSPTRASLLTGKNPVMVNITDYIPGKQAARGPKPTEKFIVPEFNNHLPLKEVTLAEKLKKIGYSTASIGKWHLGSQGYLPTDQGFDINVAGDENGMPPSYYYPYTAERFDFDIKHLPLKGDSLYLTDRLTNEAIDFINNHTKKSFFLYLPYYTVHVPWEGRADLVDKYRKKIDASNDSIIRNPDYLAMIECLDENVGRILQTLKDHNMQKNTLVIFVSDNGGLYVKEGNQVFAALNKPLRGGKGNLYEGGLRVPTIIKCKGIIEPGQVSDEVVISTDIFPTVMDALDIEIQQNIQGVSLWPHIMQNKSIDRETLYWHYPHYHRTNPGSVIRDGKYKLIHYYETDHVELYNLRKDIGEENNLADEMPDKAEELKEKLHNWLEANNANMPSPNPEYRKQKNQNN
ncbi:MAG: sulfatase, partial [Bacteroidota bacterium]